MKLWHDELSEEKRFLRRLERRQLLRWAAAGTVVTAFGGGLYVLARDEVSERARNETRPDGRVRLPDGQRVISALRPMGGRAGDSRPRHFRLRVHGAVEKPFTLDFQQLLAMPQVEHVSDVHCVTGWSVLAAQWRGVQVKALAKRAQPNARARHVVFEAAHGYTANVPIAEALADNVVVAHRLNDKALSEANGAPVRAVVPDLYFWKSAKWLRGIRFIERDAPGYWERRGYHNHGDPWKEERYG